jgi:hypothetical protein
LASDPTPIFRGAILAQFIFALNPGNFHLNTDDTLEHRSLVVRLPGLFECVGFDEGKNLCFVGDFEMAEYCTVALITY